MLDPVRQPPTDARSQHPSPPFHLSSSSHPCPRAPRYAPPWRARARQPVVVALAGDLAVPSALPSTSTDDLAGYSLWMFSVVFCTQGVCVFVRANVHELYLCYK
ncbi:hypothetical protein VPH35_060615 [Triticum aestivum]